MRGQLSPRPLDSLTLHCVQCLSPLAGCKKYTSSPSRGYKSDINDSRGDKAVKECQMKKNEAK